MSKAITDQLLHFIVERENDHRDTIQEHELYHNTQKTHLIEYIKDLRRWIETLESQIVDMDGKLDTTERPQHKDLKPFTP